MRSTRATISVCGLFPRFADGPGISQQGSTILEVRILLAAFLLMIPLGGPFGEASATAQPVGDQIEVELIVEVGESANAVIAHLVVGGDQPQTSISLDHRGGGVFGGFVTLPVQETVVVFELLGPDGGEMAPPTTLSALGVDLAEFGSADYTSDVTDVASAGLNRKARSWMWLAIGAAAAALSLFAFLARSDTADDQVASDGLGDSGDSLESDESD